MKWLPLGICVFLAALTLHSCDESKKTHRLPRHSGPPGEVLLVMNEDQWRGSDGDSLREVLEAYYPQLPQAEPSFSLLQFSPTEMSGLLRQHRNIIQVVIGSQAEGRNEVTVARNRWSNNQLVFTAYAENDSAWYALVKNEFPKVVQLINRTEIERIQARYREGGSEGVAQKVADKFGVGLTLPPECEVAKDEPDFMWIKRERIKYLGNTAHDITQGFFVYTYPYVSDSALTQKSILAVRDSLTKKYVPGPNEGTYMTTEYRYPPTSEAIEVDGRYALLTRGLWKTENFFMGGPFICLTTTDPSGQNIVSVSGFVFAPKFDKREYIREVEAVLRSITFVDRDTASPSDQPAVSG